MNAALQEIVPRPASADSRPSRRAAALAEIDGHIDNLRLCVHWLISAGVFIVGADLKRGRHRPEITVGASPYLYMLLKDDCSAGQHWDTDLGRTVYDYVAVRYGCKIKWSEAKQ